MGALVKEIKARLSIHVRRRSLALLEGGYASIHKGRSMDFDDLREYTAGDDVRDIDWKATARHGSTLIKRYVAERHFGLVVVLPGGREMSATTPAGERKVDVAVTAAGALGWLAVRHGDEVSMVSGAPGQIHATRSRAGEAHLESLLQEMHARCHDDSEPGDLVGLLGHVARHVTGRKILLVIADDGAVARDLEPVLRELRVRHELLWVSVGDIDPTAVPAGAQVKDVTSDHLLPALVEISPELGRSFAEAETARREELATLLRRLGASAARLESRDDVVPALIRLLERRRRGR